MTYELDIEPFVPRLRRFAIRLTGSTDSADDLVQETVLKMLTRPPAAKPENEQGYLMSVLHNLFIDQTRRTKRRAAVPIDDVELVSEAAHQNLAMTTRQVIAAVDALSPEFSDVIRRHAHDDQTYAEIAADLGIPIGTVMSRISRARASLRQRLGATDGDGAAIAYGIEDTGY